jgi:hypothetical protein
MKETFGTMNGISIFMFSQATISFFEIHILSAFPLIIKTNCAFIKTTVTFLFDILMKLNYHCINFSNPGIWVPKNLPFSSFYVDLKYIYMINLILFNYCINCHSLGFMNNVTIPIFNTI